jgi:pilus assembly protein CpaE
MLRGVIICTDSELTSRIEEEVSSSSLIGIARKLTEYPTMVDLTRFLRAAAPNVVFLGMENPAKAVETAERIEAQAPGTQVIAINPSSDPEVLLHAMHAGIREFLAPPFECDTLQRILLRVQAELNRRPASIEHSNAVFAFMPSKAGVGCSTVALNTGIFLSHDPDSQALLADFDLNSGVLGFMVQARNQYNIVDAAENAFTLDEHLWPKMVWKHGDLDVLTAGRMNPGFRIEPTQIRHLIDFARRHYRVICADLSGMMEKYSLEVLQEARRVFLVCTPEMASLHLGREKLALLRDVNPDGRVSVLLNRVQKRQAIPLPEIENLLGCPVEMSFANDYAGVYKALTEGREVDPASELGGQYRQFASSLSGRPIVAPPKTHFLARLLQRAERPAGSKRAAFSSSGEPACDISAQ